MEGIIEQVYLSLFVRLLIWQMRKNCNAMERLIHSGVAYSSPKLSRLDLQNQRMGMRLHTILLRLMVLQVLANQKKKHAHEGNVERQQQLHILYGGASVGWQGKADVAQK